MNEILTIALANPRRICAPGDELAGTVQWQLEHPPSSVELRLFWFTRGKGTEDVGIVQRTRFERPGSAETRAFRFQLPDAPLSFSGQLISLIWALELVAEPGKASARVEFRLAHGGREIVLECIPALESKWLSAHRPPPAP